MTAHTESRYRSASITFSWGTEALRWIIRAHVDAGTSDNRRNALTPPDNAGYPLSNSAPERAGVIAV
jgi:hypothetical protein